MKEFDVFISHASEDKKEIVSPLAKKLHKFGLNVWFDEFSLKVGDSLSRSIDKGLSKSSYGVIVLSINFLSKPWPEYELKSLLAKEIGNQKIILPIWHNITRDQILEYSPYLADKFALNTSNNTLDKIALNILEIVRPDIYKNILRYYTWEKIKKESTKGEAKLSELKPLPIQHDKLPDNFIVRLKTIYIFLGELFSSSFKEFLQNFKRDINPLDEIKIWENILAVYLIFTKGKNFSKSKKKNILSILLFLSMGQFDEKYLFQFSNVTQDDVLK